jgi:hypothetical protein
VRQHVKAGSADSTHATVRSGRIFRGAVAFRRGWSDSTGSGAPSPSRARIALITVLALAIAGLAFAAAPAFAAPPTVTTPVVSNISYTSVHLEAEASSDGSGGFGITSFGFQYSTDNVNWTTAFKEATLFNTGAFTDKSFQATVPLPKGSTEYFVRTFAYNGSFEPAEPGEIATSPGPNPSFTTLAVDPPTIPGPVEADPLLSASATAISTIKRPANADPAFDATCRFEYITDAQFVANEGKSEPGFTGATVRQCTQNPISSDKVDGEGKAAVTAPLGCTSPLTDPAESCLEPETSYHLRLVAENAAPGVVTKDAAGIFTAAPKVAPPSVIATDDASEVGQNTANVTGEVQRPAGTDPALNVECRFEFVTDQKFSTTGFEGALTAPCAQNPISSETATDVSAALSSLIPATTYHVRLTAENDGGSDAKVADDTFTTIAAELPIVAIDPVAGGTYTTAHVTGTVEADDPGHSYVRPIIEISTDNVNWSIFEAPSGPIHVTGHDYTGLQPSTAYFFRICATYNGSLPYEEVLANGELACSAEPNPSITTGELSTPTVEGLEVSEITGTSARLSANVDPHAPAEPLSELGKQAFATHWEFVCSPECKDANGNVIEGTVQGEEGLETASGLAKRLQPGTHYEVTVLVRSEGGDASEAGTFDTENIPPSVKSTPGGTDGEGGYTLQGLVNPNNHSVTGCEFKWGPTAPNYAFSAACSPMPVSGSKPLTVEAHLDSLNPDVKYHALLVVTYDAGTKATGVDQEFTATLKQPEECANEQIRKENSSLALPECRAYEMVSFPSKEGFGAAFKQDFAGVSSDKVLYGSGAGNIANSGQSGLGNDYVAVRSPVAWETIPNLNGASGSLYDVPSSVDASTDGAASAYVFSSDLRSSFWRFHRTTGPAGVNYYLRNPDGTFTLVFPGTPLSSLSWSNGAILHAADLSHFALSASFDNPSPLTGLGTGVYEYVGVNNAVGDARRVDVDNSGNPLSSCMGRAASRPVGNAQGRFISEDGSKIVVTVVGGCGGTNPPTNELWTRIDGVTSVDVSASHCSRTASDAGGVCNGPVGSGACALSSTGEEVGPGCRGAHFEGAASDGSRVFFSTTQQLVDSDTDQTNDLYACDLPSGIPTPTAEKANPCAAFTQVSGAETGAAVESLDAVSDNGATVLFTARGALTANDDALGERAVAGDHNLYVWHLDDSDPAGQTTFLGRLNSDDLRNEAFGAAQTTPDGGFLVFNTSSQLVPTDTDVARDLYRYDTKSGQLARVSTNVAGVGGNGDTFDVSSPNPGTVSDDGQKIIFTTREALSPPDGNGEPDVYLWTLGRVSLVSAGALGSGGVAGAIGGSGQDIYFNTDGALTPADGDDAGDVYDARVGGGFSFAASPICTGENCQPPASTSPPPSTSPANRPNGEGNVKPPKPCPKHKVRKKSGRCVKKHAATKRHGTKHNRANPNRGGGK